MKDRIVACLALLIFAMMLHPQRRETQQSAPRQRGCFLRQRRQPAIT
jgi:hypothetical protein